jgi:4a-hydroxytetrahydrobiopterin dehydratase
MSTEPLTGQQIAKAGLDGWLLLVKYGIGGIETRIRTENFAQGFQLVTAIGEAANELNHRAEIDLRPDRIDVRLNSGYDIGGVTEVDLTLARKISEIAAAAGVELESSSISRMELGLDTPDHEKIAPFWEAVLKRRLVTGDGWADVGDPAQANPLIWFQRSGSEEPRQRWHLDVFVDPADAQARVDAAIAAGGTLVTDGSAPGSWVLADPDGNRICLITWLPGDTVIG